MKRTYYKDGGHLTAYGVKILEKVKEHILEEPNRMDMREWLKKDLDPGSKIWDGDGVYEFTVPPCGTVGCIAGWVKTLSKKKRPIIFKFVPDEAAYILGYEPSDGDYGMVSSQIAKLFLPGDWPEPYRSRLGKHATGTEAYAKVVAARIQKFIDTKGQV